MCNIVTIILIYKHIKRSYISCLFVCMSGVHHTMLLMNEYVFLFASCNYKNIDSITLNTNKSYDKIKWS